MIPLSTTRQPIVNPFDLTPSYQAMQQVEVPASTLGVSNRLQELAVFPQESFSTAQGLVGVRVWYFCGDKTTRTYHIQKVCESHWPGFPDAVPVSVQVGAVDQNVTVSGNIPIAEISDRLPEYNQYKIVAQYQLLHISDEWPVTGKPPHPLGSVLALQVRGSGEMLAIDPSAMKSGIGALTSCYGSQLAHDETFNSRIRIPLTDYILTCDRLTGDQLCQVMSPITILGVEALNRHWKNREGTVNADCDTYGGIYGGTMPKFMNEPEGTLLFDAWTLDQTFAPDIVDPRRWRLTCVLKGRQLADAVGNYPDDCSSYTYPVGWNHDFKRAMQTTDPYSTAAGRFGWQFIAMQDYERSAEGAGFTPHGNLADGWVPRYPYRIFNDLFCPGGDFDEGCFATNMNGCDEILNPYEEETPAAPLASKLAAIIKDADEAIERQAMRQRPWSGGGASV